MEKTPEDTAMRRTHQAVALVGGAFSIISVGFFGVHVGLGAAVGAAIAAVNLHVLSRTVHAVVGGQGASWVGASLLKFLTLLAVTYGLVQSGAVAPLGLALGFGALPFGILLAGTVGVKSDSTLAPQHQLATESTINSGSHGGLAASRTATRKIDHA